MAPDYGRLVKGVLLLTAVLLAVSADPAAAAFPGTNGRIAMERRAPGATIATVNADGTGDTPGVVAVGPEDRDPAWSPDGRHLAFTSTRDGNEEIYVLDLDNGAQIRQTFDTARDHDPTWSPDGSRLAFASDRDGNSEIYVMSVDRGAATRLTFDPAIDQQPAWSSSGQIAFASDRAGSFDLYVMNEAGGAVRRVTQDPEYDSDPSWSPAGDRLAYARGSNGMFDVFAIDPDGQNQQPLAGGGHFPAWSPDGTRIAYATDQGTGSQILVMPAQGQTPGLPATAVATGRDPNWGPVPAPVGDPDPGRTVTVAPAGGARVLIAPATTQEPSTSPTLQARLRGAGEVPVGTTIDASSGSVAIDAITTTPDGPGTVGHADVRGGVFTVNQIGSAEPTLRLAAGVRICQTGLTSRVPDPEGRMRIRARGRFRTVTGYGRGAGRGTEWLMHDRCDGTIFRVFEGIVLVHDYRRKLTFRVRAGQCYLAATQRRKDALRPRRTCPRLRPPR